MVKKRTCIYVLEEAWKEFVKICRREGTNASSKLEAFIQAYNQQHRVGNPQLLITHYVNREESQPMRVLCVYCQGALTDGRIFCQRKGMWIPGVSCYGCKFNRLKKQK